MTTNTLPTNHRSLATITAINVAREWAIETHGDRYFTITEVETWTLGWLRRNGALIPRLPTDAGYHDTRRNIATLVDSIFQLADLPQVENACDLLEEGWHGTDAEARAMLTEQYEIDMITAVNRITWKD